MAHHLEKGILPQEPIVYSLVDLDKFKSVRAIDIMATLRDYAGTGAIIKGDLVNGILERTELDESQFLEIKDAAVLGAIIQYRRMKPYTPENEKAKVLKDVGEYIQVASFAKKQLDRRHQK